ncbi:trypsin-like peptidase domain-containing protein [Streptomyces sp. NPDC058685]|uniref:trypsin-like peptidase domain-containing protein n=1 Tax=Streptomyces sp. NPDC058685 TaxID=3346598 RepID=UPI0036625659
MGRGDLATLVRICDLAGRPRGTGFVADHLGTVVTSHEAVDGLVRVVLHAPGERTCLAEADAITPLPEAGLALVRTDGLGVRPLPIGTRERIEAGTYVRLPAGGWREARILGSAQVTYTATDRFHLVAEAVELAIGTDGSDALRLGGGAAGGPVLDASTGAVLAVLGTALQSGHRAAGFALPLRTAAAPADGPLADLLRRNAATVPAYGRDLNLAAVLELTATSVGAVGGPSAWPAPVERPELLREFGSFTALVLGLVGDPGTGRTTELTALAGRRGQGARPAPTVWLRGADLHGGDTSVADAFARTLGQAGRIIAASGAHGDMGHITPERVARLARAAGRPLMILLDGPEEMPPQLAHRLAHWTAGTVQWLSDCGVRMVVGCRPEYWEQAGALCPPEVLHRPAGPAFRLPPAVRVGDLSADEAREVRERYGLPADAIDAADERHPLALRLLAEVREALPGGVPGRPSREEIFTAHLDLLCLRIAVRIAAASRPPLRGAAVRRLAARVSGRVHEAARRCLGPGQGELDRESFEEIFPWRTGWASAVLTEGLLVPAGTGYRFAHEEMADWVQGAHLDLDAALHSLVHRWHTSAPAGLPSRPGASGGGDGYVPPPPGSGAPRASTLAVPRHRIGPVVQALLLLDSVHGPAALTRRLGELIHALERLDEVREDSGGDGPTDPERGFPQRATGEGDAVVAPDPAAAGDRTGAQDRVDDARWWGAHLLGETLLRVPDARDHLPVLRLLADRITRRSVREGGPEHLGGFGEFGPWFWERLQVPEDERLDLLRRLVPADGPPGARRLPRYLDAAAARLADSPSVVQPLLCRWFTDTTPLPAEPGAEMRPTVAGAAQALLYARRDLAVDDLTEALVATAHPRADELLVALAEDEPSALCRAIDRWAHDPRPERRVAAAAYGPVTAARVTTEADRELLRYAAFALLARAADTSLHGAALALLVRDPHTRSRHLGRALATFATGDPQLPVSALATALTTHPEPVLAAFRERLRQPGEGAAEVLRALAEVDEPVLAYRAAELVGEYLDHRPEGAAHAAAYVERRLEQGPAARAVLFPLVRGLLRGRPCQVRRALAPVLAAPGTVASRALRSELLDILLDCEEREQALGYGPAPGHGSAPDAPAYGRVAPQRSRSSRDLSVLDAVLRAAALGCATRPQARTRDLVHRTGMLLVRTPEGATCFDRRLVELAREVPGFAAQVAGWLAGAPREWAAVVGPSARRMVETLGSPVPMRAGSRGHGSLRPA